MADHVHIDAVIYPVMWCHRCDGDRPHFGPFCMSCGRDRTEACCPERGECAGCDRALCIDHSPDFYGCAATGDWHDACHDDGCGTCQAEAAREWVEEHDGR